MRSPHPTFEALETRQFLSAAPAPAAALSAPAAPTVVAPLAAAPTPSAGGTTITRDAGHSFTARLGEVTVKVVDLTLNAVVDWGDGTTSAGRMTGSYATGEYYIAGRHTYASPGTYRVTAKVFAHPIGSPVLATSPIAGFVSVFHAAGPRPSAGGVSLTEVATRPFTANVGQFTYKTVDQALDAVIDWGDGSHSAGRLEGSYATGRYYVEGTHAYAHTGTFKVTVNVFGHPVGTPIHPTEPLAKIASVIRVVGDA